MKKLNEKIRLRQPTIEDGPKLWQLVADCGTLDQNSTYAYLLLCKDFSNTCLVAEAGDSLVGFVTGYRPPNSPDTLFVWQIGVSAEARGHGLAKRLLTELIQGDACRDASFIETTISPSNTASRALFNSFARQLGVELVEQPCFGEELFPQGNHEPEHLFRIGPIPSAARCA
jgi:L-2,4-diaminobutyric acid acetyltransferase